MLNARDQMKTREDFSDRCTFNAMPCDKELLTMPNNFIEKNHFQKKRHKNHRLPVITLKLSGKYDNMHLLILFPVPVNLWLYALVKEKHKTKI